MFPNTNMLPQQLVFPAHINNFCWDYIIVIIEIIWDLILNTTVYDVTTICIPILHSVILLVATCIYTSHYEVITCSTMTMHYQELIV